MSQVRRAFATGGAEAAQEATSQILQNLIAKGQYKPDQALLEGSGEAAAYGGGIGALIQGITDLAIGRRAKGGQPSTTPTAGEIPPVTPAPAAPDLTTQKPEELILAAERLKQQPVTPEQAAQLDAIREELRTRDLAEVAARQKVIEDEAFAAKEAAAAEALRAQPTTEMQQVEMRAAMPEGELPPQLDLFGNPLAPAPDQAEPTVGDLLGGVELTTENMQDAGLARTPQELEALGQQRLPLRRTPEGKPTTTAPVVEAAKPVAPVVPAPVASTIPEPILRPAPTVYTPETAPTVLGPDTFKALGIGPTAVIRKAPIVGLDITDPANAAQIKRDLEMYREGRSEGIQAKIDRYLARPEFKAVPSEPVNVQPSLPASPPTVQATEPGGSQPSVEVPVQPTEPAPVQPAAAAAPAKPAETVGLGLAPAGPLASTGTAAKGTPPAALTPETPTPTATAPDVDSIKRFSVGPGGITPKVVARDKPTYHETNPQGLESLLSHDKRFELNQVFVSDNADLALGQQGNAGVFIEFRPNSISGKAHSKLGTSEATGQEFRTDVVAPKAVNSVTVKNPAKFTPLPATRRVLNSEFTKTTLPDGSLQYVRRGTTPTGTLPITWTADAKAPAKPAAVKPVEPVNNHIQITLSIMHNYNRLRVAVFPD